MNNNYPQHISFNIDNNPTSLFSRPTRAIINLDLYRENLISIKNAINTKVMAIVKANAYGHGLLPISKVAEGVVDFFGVAVLEEAASLRKSNIKKPILVLGYVNPLDYVFVANEEIRVPLFSYEQWLLWKQQISTNKAKKIIKFHLKVNSGMNRLGFQDEDEMLKTLGEIEEHKYAKIEGIFTHFATADSPNDLFISTQEDTFTKMTRKLDKEKYFIHIANSAYTLSRQNPIHFNLVRIGILGYGLLPDPLIKTEMTVATKPILSLKTEIVHIQDLSKGDRVGYGCTYIANSEEKIGIIPIGYADGLLRRYAEKGYVLVNGEKRYFAGRICMDQAMIILKDSDRVGDEVIIYGKQQNEEITLDIAAQNSNTINYELSCLISSRVRRVYE